MDGVNNNSVSEDMADVEQASDSHRDQVKPAELRPRRRSNQHELISLSNLPQELSLNHKTGKSISFSGVSYVIDRLLSSRNSLSNTQLEVEEAVQRGDTVRIEAMRSSQDHRQLNQLAKAAIRSGNSELLLHTLRGLDLNTFNQHSQLLHEAAQRGEEEICKLLITEFRLSANTLDEESSETPVHCAAAGGHLSILRFLHTTAGGDLNATGGQSPWTPLHAAVSANQVETVAYLLENKAHSAPVSFSSSPLHLASENNQTECVATLLAHNVLVDPLRGQRERETPLHLASAQGYTESSKLLLQHGADPNARNSRGETSLHLASKVLAGSLMVILIERGALVEAADNDGRPPLHCVINSKSKGGRESMKVLIDRGADVNQADKSGLTPLHMAAVNAKQSRLDLLIMAGADLCIRNSAGQSALQFSMKHLPLATMAAIEKRLDASISFSSSVDSELEAEVKMDFAVLLPPAISKSGSVRSEVELFNEMLCYHQADSVHIERLLLHPLSQGYLHLKWSQIQRLYYVLIVMTHLIYSLIYSVYSMAVFRVLCPPSSSADDEENYFTITCNFEAATSATVDGVCVAVITLRCVRLY
jgi:ankyrin repeat protein